MSNVRDDIAVLRSAGAYASEEDVLRDALQALLSERPELRLELAVAKYRDRDISLNRAAEVAGLSAEEFKQALDTRGERRPGSFLSDEERTERLTEF